MTNKQLLILILAALPTFGGQSIQFATTNASASVPAVAISTPYRVEFSLHDWATTPTFAAGPVTSAATGTNIQLVDMGSGNWGVQLYTDTVAGSVCRVNMSGLATKFVTVRFQHDPANLTDYCEAWNILGIRFHSTSHPYTSESGSHSAGALVGSTGENISTAYFRVYTSIVAVGSRPPVTADTNTNCLVHWKFDSGLTDSSGNGYTATLSGGSATYVSTPGQTLISGTIRTLDAPTWTNWISMRAGYPAQLDAATFYSQSDASATVAYFWQLLSGPSPIAWSSHTSVSPTVTGLVFGDYHFQLHATAADGSSSVTTQHIGAVAMDTNGSVVPASTTQADIFGSQIAFGKNPWAFADERHEAAVALQTIYQPTANDFSWTTTGQGTISYPYTGKGFAPGPACTTLSAGISATDTSIQVADATCLSLGSLPTWILVGTSLGSIEMVRISATTATTGAATLTVAFDGRGVSGNVGAFGGYTNVGPAAAWSSGALVGEMRVQGTGTLFSTDANRPICPAGLPGPPGAVAYATGTVTLSAASTTVTGSGTTWNTANGVVVGGFIRVAATHSTGTPFVYWAQIVTVTDTTHLVLNRPAPTGVDATAFTFKITSPAMHLSLEFTAADGHLARNLSNGVGCESETAMFSLPTHDVAALNSTVMSGLKYSYKTTLTEVSSTGTFDPNFYGTGLMARNFYHRSGYGPALDLANSVDEYWVRDPTLADGIAPANGLTLAFGGGVIGAMVDIALNPSSAMTWQNVDGFAARGQIGALACNAWDTRDSGYLTGWLTLAANYHTTGATRTAYKSALGTVLTRDQGCKRNAADGYAGAQVNSFAHSFVWSPSASTLSLTNASAAVTGTGFTSDLCAGVDIGTIQVTAGLSTATVISGTLTQQMRIYITDTVSSPIYVGGYEYTVTGSAVQLAGVWPGASGTFTFMSENNSKLGYVSGIAVDNTESFARNLELEKPWACKYNSSTSLTLNRPWDGTTGSSYRITSYIVGPFGQQPFVFGVKANQVNWASKNDDATIAAGYAAILPLMGEWYNSYGYDSVNTKGTFYNSVFKLCEPPTVVAAGSFVSIHGYDVYPGCGWSGVLGKAIARVNSAEGGSAMLQYYLGDPTAGRKTTVDTFYGAIFGSTAYCDASVLSSCDGTTAENIDDIYMGVYKWPGFFFGMGGFFTTTWPSIRLGGVLPADPKTISIGFGLSGVPNATQVRCTLYFPSGATATATTSTSPCTFTTADARQGSHLYRLEYLSAGSAVLAAGSKHPVAVQ